MSPNLRLVVKQSEQDVSDYKMMQRVEYYACRKCNHRWACTLEHMVYHPECPKCGK